MFQRDLTDILNIQAKLFPVMTILGPRQSGKNTLVKNLYPKKKYWNLEEPDTRALFTEDPRHFLTAHQHGIILDEIQRAPELLSYIQSIVDKTQQAEQYILTGSHQMALGEAISQSPT